MYRLKSEHLGLLLHSENATKMHLKEHWRCLVEHNKGAAFCKIALTSNNVCLYPASKRHRNSCSSIFCYLSLLCFSITSTCQNAQSSASSFYDITKGTATPPWFLTPPPIWCWLSPPRPALCLSNFQGCGKSNKASVSSRFTSLILPGGYKQSAETLSVLR